MKKELILITLVLLLIGAVMVIADDDDEIPPFYIGDDQPTQPEPKPAPIKTPEELELEKQMLILEIAGFEDTWNKYRAGEITLTPAEIDQLVNDYLEIKGQLEPLSQKERMALLDLEDEEKFQEWLVGHLERQKQFKTEEDLRRERIDKIREAAKTGDAGDLWDYLTDAPGVFAAYVFKAYSDYGNFLSWTSLFPGLTPADVQARKDELNQKFCVIGGLDKCFKSLVCSSIYDTRAGQAEIIARDISGMPINVATIKGYKIGPITIKGLPRQTLIDWFGDKTVIQGITYDFTDPSFDSNLLPEQEIYLYQIQYILSNPKAIQERGFYKPAEYRLKYNLQFKGARTAKWWQTDQTLDIGKTTEDNILKYSFTNYDKVCLTMSPRIRTYDLFWGGDKKGKICDKFETYAGAPTLIAGHPSTANPAAQTPGTPGQTV